MKFFSVLVSAQKNFNPKKYFFIQNLVAKKAHRKCFLKLAKVISHCTKKIREILKCQFWKITFNSDEIFNHNSNMPSWNFTELGVLSETKNAWYQKIFYSSVAKGNRNKFCEILKCQFWEKFTSTPHTPWRFSNVRGQSTLQLKKRSLHKSNKTRCSFDKRVHVAQWFSAGCCRAVWPGFESHWARFRFFFSSQKNVSPQIK